MTSARRRTDRGRVSARPPPLAPVADESCHRVRLRHVPSLGELGEPRCGLRRDSERDHHAPLVIRQWRSTATRRVILLARAPRGATRGLDVDDVARRSHGEVAL